MPQEFTSKYKNYQDFIRQHHVDKDDKTTQITNTRIGDPDGGHAGGKYFISNLEYSEFLDLYYRDVVSKGLPEFLTEKQLETSGPIVVDIDLRYTYETEEKQYKKAHIDDIVQIYLEQLKHIYIFDNRVNFPIYVFEKQSVNRLKPTALPKPSYANASSQKCPLPNCGLRFPSQMGGPTSSTKESARGA